MSKLFKNESFIICLVGFAIIAVFAFMFSFLILADYPKDFNYARFTTKTVIECEGSCEVIKDGDGVSKWKDPPKFVKIRNAQ
jgi:hypothetical protein